MMQYKGGAGMADAARRVALGFLLGALACALVSLVLVVGEIVGRSLGWW